MSKIIEKLVILIFFIFLLIVFIHPFEGTGDFYHHVNTGKYIIDNKSLPNLDTFSHTAKGLPWVAHSWLSGVIFYLFFTNFGQISITILSSLVALVTFILLYLLLTGLKASKTASILTITLVAVAFSTRWPQRPEIFAYPLTISLLLIDVYKNRVPWLNFLFPIVILVWANLYGSGVLFGLALICFLAFKQFVTDKLRVPKNRYLFYINIFAALPISFFNGYGANTIFYFYLFIPQVAVYEGEWAGILKIFQLMPFSQLITYQYLILIYFIFLINFLILLISSLRLAKNNLFWASLSVYIFMPIFAFRQLPLAAILSAPIIAKILTEKLANKQLFFLIAPILSGIIGLAITVWLATPRISTPPNMAATQLVDFIKNNKLEGKALNLGHFGGFLTYNLYPQVLVFFDTRDDLYVNTPALKDLYDTYTSGKGLMNLLNKYSIDVVIADYLTDGLNYKDLVYSLDWSIVYLNDRYFVAVPTKMSKNKNLTSLDFLDPFSFSAAKSGFEQKAADYYKNLIKTNPDSLNNKLFLSSTLLALEQYDQVINLAQDLTIDQNSLFGPLMEQDRDFLISEAYLGQNDCVKAKKYLDQASVIAPLLIFSPQKKFSSKSTKGYTLYYAQCQKDRVKTGEFLKLFLQDNMATPLEKAKILKQVEQFLPGTIVN